jgi:hypothetical protein
MKKLIIVLLLGLLIAGSVFAQWGGHGYNPAAQTMQTITGTLQIINGILAIVNANNQVYYVPNLQPYVGANGMYVNTTVTVYGTIGNNNYCDPYRFMAGGTWYNFPVYNYYYAPPPVYVPMYMPPPPRYYPRHHGMRGW